MAAQNPHHPRRYLVDLPYQLQFVARLLIVILGITIVSSLIAMAILWKNLYRPGLDRQLLISASLIGIALTLIIESLIAIPLAYYLGIRQSHRVVGPLRRITKALEAAGSGAIAPPLTLRRADVLRDLATAINEMAKNLQKRHPKSPS